MLTKDPDRWDRMKVQTAKIRVKYRNLTERINARLNSGDIRLVRRWRKFNQSSTKYSLNDSEEHEYEYDDLNSPDEFERIDDIRHMCDEIHWNVLNTIDNSTVYILTTYNVSNQIVCSLSDVDPHTRYHHVCEYGLSFLLLPIEISLTLL